MKEMIFENAYLISTQETLSFFGQMSNPTLARLILYYCCNCCFNISNNNLRYKSYKETRAILTTDIKYTELQHFKINEMYFRNTHFRHVTLQ
jgi:hypothetical protein